MMMAINNALMNISPYRLRIPAYPSFGILLPEGIRAKSLLSRLFGFKNRIY